MRGRQILGLLGILVVLVGIGLDSTPVVWVAIGILGASQVGRIILAVRNRSSRARSGEQD